ncbi:MAG TPA: PAS domain S-box protein, partial [Gemmatimonadaceae bacterium]|nr:PAS domain S-box protein [Gemmatimonadaceae bacterium]
MQAYFDRLARLAAQLLDAPIGVATLAEGDALLVAGVVGLPLRTGADASAECTLTSHVHRTGRPLVLGDLAEAGALLDVSAAIRFGARAFIGLPLRRPDGACAGVLAVAAHAPRAWTAEARGALDDLACLAEHELQRRHELEERRDAERALAVREERLRLAISATNDMVWDWDLEHGLRYRSEAFHSVFGYDPRPEYQEERWWTSRIHPDDRGVETTLLRAIAGTADSWCGEYRIRRADDSWATVLDRALVLRDEAGRATRVVGATTDISALRAAEQTAAAAEGIFRGLVEQSLTGVFIARDDVFAYVNPRLATMLGARPEELLALDSIASVLAPECREEALERLRMRDDGESHTHCEFTALRPDGTRVQLEVYATTATYAGRPARLGTVLDVTERHHAEEALRESEARFRSLSASSPVGIFQVDLEARLTYANPRARAMWGREGAVLRDREWLDWVHPDDRNGLTESWYGALREGRDFAHTYRVVADGAVRWVRSVAGPLRNAQGSIAGAVGTVEDVTERMLLEEQLRQSQKMEAVGRLAGGVAHDFNNLLTVIRVHTEMLIAASRDDDPMREDLVEVERAAQRASDLTRQLLAFSRKQILQPRTVDLTTTVVDLQRMLGRLIGEDIRIDLVLAPELRAVRADPGQLEQVLVNLAVNARDAMPRGGTLTIETANVRTTRVRSVHDEEMPAGEYVRLSVQDSGVGMPPEVAARVFEPFYTTKGAGEGTGLGLSTVYGIVKQSGGYVVLRTAPARGTAFIIYLPAVAAEPAPTVTAPVALRPRTAGTVLLAEDEPAVRRIACRILESAGLTVVEAHDGRQALRVAREHTGSIDLLLTDAVMPEMSGPELASE